MPSYQSPGVYIEEVQPLARPISGVGTSTAGFIGVVPNKIEVPSGGAPVSNASAGNGKTDTLEYPLPEVHYPVVVFSGTFAVRVANKPVANATLKNENSKSWVKFVEQPTIGAPITVDCLTQNFTPVTPREVQLCTTFSDFTKAFGNFSKDEGQRKLAHAVFGFFNNGGSRCYVAREISAGAIITGGLTRFEAIDEIAIVAAPGVDDVRNALANHCERMKDRFAILECKEADDPEDPAIFPNSNSYAAFYLPWIEVFDPATEANVFVPPSGHLAGMYARVDSQRGVHKAPANESLSGALGLKFNISTRQQDGLNPKGGNCIRRLRGNIYVWGARTIGVDNGEFRYISTRRYFNYLRESIEQGMQFVVFEPNSPSLWERIKRTAGDFLLNEWRNGALFGDTPKQAFFVRCDAETNLDRREAGEVITEIGVAIVKPAEFVIFRIQQQTGS